MLILLVGTADASECAERFHSNVEAAISALRDADAYVNEGEANLAKTSRAVSRHLTDVSLDDMSCGNPADDSAYDLLSNLAEYFGKRTFKDDVDQMRFLHQSKDFEIGPDYDYVYTKDEAAVRNHLKTVFKVSPVFPKSSDEEFEAQMTLIATEHSKQLRQSEKSK